MLKITDPESYHNYVAYVKEHYKPLHPHLYKLDKNIFTPSFRLAADRGEDLLNIINEIHPQIYSWQLFTAEFCREFIAEVRHFEQWCVDNDIEKRLPNSMNNYGVVLGDFGFYDFLQQFMLTYIKPITSTLYPEVGGDSLDYHHSFIVEYAVDKDVALDFHVDASDVTLNICLGNEFSGGDLYFGGIRCAFCQETTPRKDEEIGVCHEPGHAILHRGKHRHSAQDIQSGERINMIMWCMSSKNQQATLSECPTWCGNYKK